jgi:hypothetical protein
MRSPERSAATANATACRASAFIAALHNEYSRLHDEGSLPQRDLVIDATGVEGPQPVETPRHVFGVDDGVRRAVVPTSANGGHRESDNFAKEH